MSEADVKTFNLQFDTWCIDRLTGLSDVKPFEFFCADQCLKSRSLSDKEILYGQVDGKDDGGVDGFYCFLNNSLVDDTTQIDARAGGLVELKIFQCKQGEGFSPIAVNKFGAFMDDLLSFNRTPANFRYEYHAKLLKLMTVFKEKFQELLRRSTPKLSIEFFYITRRDVWPNQNVKRAIKRLVEDDLPPYYSETVVEPFNCINVGDLWSLFKTAPPKVKLLPLETSFDTKEGWVGLVTLKNYYQFLTNDRPLPDGKPQIDEHLFDSNVRGYQLTGRVNTRITKTLTAVDKAAKDPQTKLPPEFWLLNNGITILSPRTNYSDEQLSIDNPQIVNGLQTSRRIFDYCRSIGSIADTDTRRILVRVIKTNDEATRSDIIRATNDQNPMPPEAFLATLRLQHQIESYFEEHGLFYDRRKGHYKSLLKPAAQIVGIVDLMQSVLAILLRKPDVARGRPRDYLKDGKRQQLFGPDDPNEPDGTQAFGLDAYLRCVQIVRKIETYLSQLNIDDRTSLNILFYMALDLSARIAKNAYCPPGVIIAIDVERDLTVLALNKSRKRIMSLYKKHGEDDTAAKAKFIAKDLVDALKRDVSPPKKTSKKETKKGSKKASKK